MFSLLAVFATINANATAMPLAMAGIVCIGVIMMLTAVDAKVGKNGNGHSAKVEWVPLEKIKRHFDNPRLDPAYDENDRDFKVLDASFVNMGGWDYSSPAVLFPARDPITHERLNNDEWDCGKGNRRLVVAKKRRIEMVPAIKRTDLTYQEELDILFDHHDGSRSLNRAETYRAYVKYAPGHTRDEIALKLGYYTAKTKKPAVAKVDELERLSMLPAKLRQDWLDDLKPTKDKDIPPTGDNLKALELAIRADKAAKFRGTVENGPNFTAKVAEIKGETAGKPKVYTKKEIDSLSLGASDSPVAHAVLATLVGSEGAVDDMADAINAVRWLEVKALKIPHALTSQPNLITEILRDISTPKVVDTNDKVPSAEPEKISLPPEVVAKRNLPKRTIPAPVTSKRK